MGKRICCSILWQQLLPTTILNQLGLYLVSHRYACHLCAAVSLLRVFFAFLFSFCFAFLFCACGNSGNPSLSLSLSRSACILWMRIHDKRSIKSQVAVDAGASTCLASAGELRRAVRYNIATCRIRNVTSFTLWPTKVKERGEGGRECKGE